MNLTELRKELKAIDPLLQENDNRIQELEPLVKSLKQDLDRYDKELNFLHTTNAVQFKRKNDLIAWEKRLMEKESELRQDEKFKEEFAKVEDFYEALVEPLQNWINQNEKRLFGLVKPNYKKAIEKMQKDEKEYINDRKAMPNFLLADLISAKRSYENTVKDLIKINILKPDNWKLKKNQLEMRKMNIFYSWFSHNSFKSWLQ